MIRNLPSLQGRGTAQRWMSLQYKKGTIYTKKPTRKRVDFSIAYALFGEGKFEGGKLFLARKRFPPSRSYHYLFRIASMGRRRAMFQTGRKEAIAATPKLMRNIRAS